MILIGIVLTASCSPSLTEAEMTATQEALVSSTPTWTDTPTVTQTLPPTLTPTITLTPTPAQPPIEIEVQDDGTNLVQVNAYGFQFVLPAGWTYRTPTMTRFEQGWEAWPMGGDENSVSLRVTLSDTRRSAESEARTRANLFDYADDCNLLSHDVTTNQHNVSLFFIEARGEYLGNDNFHQYLLYFDVDGKPIEFKFSGNINAIRYAIGLIQNSIQWID